MLDFLEGLPRPLRLFWWTLVAASALCGICVGISALRHYGYPYISPFFPFHWWLDFFDFRIRFTHYHTLDFFNLDRSKGWIFSYPPPMGLLYALAYLPSAHQYLFFNCVVMPLCAVLAWMLVAAMRRRGVAAPVAWGFVGTTALLAYPFWFNYLLGNFEICVFLIVAFAVVAFLRRHAYLAAGLLGVAGSMKIFPFFLLGLFLARRRYKPVAFALALAAGLYLFATWMECPSLTVAFRGMGRGADAMRENIIVKWISGENSFDHSLFALFKRLVHGHFNGVIPPNSLPMYVGIVAVVGLLLFFFRIVRLPFLNQLLSLYIACCLLPPMSHHYTLMHLYVPWGLLVLYAIERHRRGEPAVPGLTALLVCLALLFAPESEFIFHSAGFGGQIKCLVLLACWGIAMVQPLQSEWDTAAALS